MSWDPVIVRIKGTFRPVTETVDEDYELLGSAEFVRDAINAAFPSTEWSNPTWAVYSGRDFQIEFSVQPKNDVPGGPIPWLLLHVHGRGDVISALLKLCNRHGWLVVDTSAGAFIDPMNPSYESWQGFQDLVARGMRDAESRRNGNET